MRKKVAGTFSLRRVASISGIAFAFAPASKVKATTRVVVGRRTMSFPANPATTWAVGVGAIVGEAGELPTGTGAVDCVRGVGGLVTAGRDDGESGGAVVPVDAVAVGIALVDVGPAVGVRVCCEDPPEPCAPWHPTTPSVRTRAATALKRVRRRPIAADETSGRIKLG